MAFADGNIIIGTSVDMYGMNTGLKKIKNAVKQLSYFAGATLGIVGLVKFGKAALDAASDVQEVQNVVDVSFGEMSWMVEDFAKTCIEKFGMSELAAKQTAGSFMAMGKSLGLTKDTAAKMSLQLTGLTGDFASFYNISQDYARVALSAIYTGETETLKRYGIVLTEANLQEFAAKRGIEGKVKAMDAATKTMLRYQYVMAATTDITGDFARTADSWANQVRVLQERWKQLLITVGNGLKVVFTPVLRYLNQVLGAFIKFANTIGAILAKLFGLKWSSVSGDIGDLSDSLSGVSDGAEDAADGLDDAGDSAKKAGKEAKKALAPFDELNNVLTDTGKAAKGAAGGGGAGGLDDLGFDLGGGWSGFDPKVLLPDIADLFELGRYLSKLLEDMLRNIDWAKVYLAAKNFGKGLADFLNGLITPSLFDAIGETIANSLNAALNAAFTFGKLFDWTNLGRSLAAGVNSFFENFDFELLGRTINVWAKGILDTILQFMRDVDWELIGKQIGTLLKTIDWIGILSKVGEVIWEAINAAVEMYVSMFETAPFETAVLTIVGIFALLNSQLGTALASGINNLLLLGQALFGITPAMMQLEKTSPLLSGIIYTLDMFKVAFGDLIAAIAGGSSVFAGLQIFFDDISRALPLAAKGIIGVVAAIGEFFIIKNAVEDLITAVSLGEDTWMTWVKAIGEIVVAFGLAATAFSMVFGFPGGLIAAGIVAVIAGFVGINDAINTLSQVHYEEVFSAIIASTEDGTHTLHDYKTVMQDVADAATADIDKMNEKFKHLDESRSEVEETCDVITRIHTVMQSTGDLTKDEIKSLSDAFKGLKEDLTSLIEEQYDMLMQQEIVDRAYLKSIGEWNDAVDDERFQKTIANLQAHKQAAIADAETIIQTSQEATDELQKQFEAYEKGEIELEDYNKAITAYADAISPAVELTQQLSGKTDEVKKITDDASSSIEKLSGKLKLTGSDIEHTNDLQTQAKTAVTDMRTAYENAVLAVGEESKKYREELDKMSLSEEDRARALENHNKTVKEKLTKLQDTYATSLGAIQGDIVELVPKALEEFGKKWNDLSWWEKNITWGGDKEKYMKESGAKFVQDVIGEGDGSLGEELERAFDSLGVEGGNWAKSAADEMLQNMFITAQDDLTYALDTQLNPALQEAINKTGTFADEAVKQYGFKDKFIQWGKDLVAGFNEGVDENGDTTNTSITDWIDKVVGFIHDSALKFGSPSQTAHDFGADTVVGFNEGIDAEKDSTQSIVDEWLNGIKELFTPFIEEVGAKFTELPEQIKQAFNDISSWFETNVFTPINEGFNNFIQTTEHVFSEIHNTVTDIWDDIVSWFENDIVQNLIQSFSTFQGDVETIFDDLWSGIQDIWGNVTSWFEQAVCNPIRDIFNNWQNDVEQIFNSANDAITNIWGQVSSWFESQVADPVKQCFENALQEIERFFSDLWSNIETIWGNACGWFESTVIQPVQNLFNNLINGPGGLDSLWQTLWESVETGGRNAINSVISVFESGINGIIRMVNSFIDGFNKVASGVASTAGVSYSSIPNVSSISIPRLAKGAVIPPNKQFIAMLGDQKHGTNIETPLETMVDAMYQALQKAGLGGGNNQDIVVQIDGYEIARATRKQDRIFRQSTGHSMFGY